jgi:hypothetical protein
MSMLLLSLLVLDPADAGRKDKAPPMPSWFLTPPAGCGAGSAIFDPVMREIAKVEADTQARADLTRQVQTNISSIVKTAYNKSTNSKGATSASASAESVTKSVTEMSLLGARTVASEVQTGTLYLMVCIEPESLISSFEEMAYLDDAMRMAMSDGVRQTYGGQVAQLQALGLGG